ncbi:MAG: NUDIX domain-containing protein [Clostridia bacterium]|nr:NUDIX domain-containing protein [Clostridia bacterium]
MEIFDIVDEMGNPTGETVERTYAHTMGIRHRTSHIWVIRKSGGKVQALLQKRSDEKDSFPGCYDTSSSGHIHAGDEPLYSATRELFEELGIKAEPEDLIPAGMFPVDYILTFHGEPFYDVETAFVFIYLKDVDEKELKFSDGEVTGVRWFDMDYIEKTIKERTEGFCVPPGGFQVAKKWCDENM